jgi:hypothetical protein
LDPAPGPVGLLLGVAEIIEARDITARDQDGWTISYGVRRSDDREVPVLASCSRTAEASIRSDDARFEVRWLPRLLEEDGQ